MAAEEPQRHRKRSSRQSSEESLSPHRSRSGSRSTLSSPGGSPRHHRSPRKSERRRRSAEALEQGIAAIRSHYGYKRVSVAYVQGTDHTAAILTLSRENSPIMDRAHRHHGNSSNSDRYYSIRSSRSSVKGRRQTSAVIEQTKSSMLSSPKNNGPKTSPKSQSSSGHSRASLSSPALIDGKREHKHRTSTGHHSHPTSKTALLSGQSSNHSDKSKVSTAGPEEVEYDDVFEEEPEVPRIRGKYSGKRGLEMALVGCVVLMGTGALLVAFMWGATDPAWTILGSTCMSLGALCLVLGICWYLSKTRDPSQEERLEIRVVDAKQMAKLIKQGFRVKPVDSV